MTLAHVLLFVSALLDSRFRRLDRSTEIHSTTFFEVFSKQSTLTLFIQPIP
jgi:hypothetical protein